MLLQRDDGELRRLYPTVLTAIERDRKAGIGASGPDLDVNDAGGLETVLRRQRAGDQRHRIGEARGDRLAEDRKALGQLHAVQSVLHVGVVAPQMDLTETILRDAGRLQQHLIERGIVALRNRLQRLRRERTVAPPARTPTRSSQAPPGHRTAFRSPRPRNLRRPARGNRGPRRPRHGRRDRARLRLGFAGPRGADIAARRWIARAARDDDTGQRHRDGADPLCPGAVIPARRRVAIPGRSPSMPPPPLRRRGPSVPPEPASHPVRGRRVPA
jgi:hypothetical protein